MPEATVPSLLGNVGAGFQLGSQLGQRQRSKQNQQLMGGLRRQSLGLGGESAEQQKLAQRQMLSADPEAAQKFLTGYATLSKNERDMIDDRNKRVGLGAQNIINMSKQNPDFLVPAINQTAQMFLNSGENDLAAKTLQIRQLAEQDPEKAQMHLQSLVAQSRDIEDVVKAGQGDIKKIREEGRRFINDGMGKLNDRVDNIETQWGKINELANQIDDGNRYAVSQGLVSLVKIGEPNSAVLVAEMEAALNNETPVAAITQLLLGKNVGQDVIDSVLAKLDVLNPDNISTEDMRNTARSMAATQVDPMRNTYADFENRASKLSDEGKESVLSGNFVDRLGNLEKTLAFDALGQSNDALGAEVLPQGLDRETIDYNMKKFGKTEQEVIDAYKAKKGIK